MLVLHRQRISHLKLARKSSITHPLGVVLETPLLVPSFSSKGFLFKKTKTRLISEVADFMDVSAEVLTESMLVSAYDVHHKHIQPLTQCQSQEVKEAKPEASTSAAPSASPAL